MNTRDPFDVKVEDLADNGDLVSLRVSPDGPLLATGSTAHVRFRLLVKTPAGIQEANKLLLWSDFEEWLDAYAIPRGSAQASSIASGVPVDIDAGTVRFVRVDERARKQSRPQDLAVFKDPRVN